MNGKAIEVLVIEDNGGDARLLREMLNEPATQHIRLTHVKCMAEAERYLADHRVDIILLDLGLPDAEELEGLERAQAAAPHIPVVVLTGRDDESLASQALHAGAQDYLIKGQLDSRALLRALRYAIERNTMEEAASAMALAMTHSAQHDFLTGLPNRMLLNDRISQAIALAPRYNRQVAVLFLDIDGFKHINDSLGHPFGDKLLKSIASRIVSCVRASDTVSRQGGDEFVVLLTEAEQAEGVSATATRILQSVSETHSISKHDLHVTTSIGVSMYPGDGLNAETLIKNADTAMYQAKENGRHSYRFFKPAMNVQAVERQSIEEDLRRALDRQEFSLHYQPKIDLASGSITGAEALIRWMHPTRGLISPAQFIPVAEDSGLILPIGNWVLQEACRQGRAWVEAGLPATTMAVNVSAVQFRDEHFLEGVFSILDDTGMRPESLELELTESVLMKRVEATASLLQTLRERGIQIAIDDFGTGYSSLSYLRKFPVDALKIDQSFVRQITAGSTDTTIVSAVISMARSLGIRVVAEGVETEEQLAFLREHQCEEGQGYLFGRPMPAMQFSQLLSRQMETAFLKSKPAPLSFLQPAFPSTLNVAHG